MYRRAPQQNSHMKKLIFICSLSVSALLYGCAAPAANNTAANNANANSANANASPAAQTLTVVDRPQKIVDLMASRGEQDNAKPVIKVLEPKADSVVNGSTVKVKLQITGDLKGYKPMMDEATHAGNHIHVILDNQPYEAYYNLDQPFELRNLADGEHTLRVFPSRPWHESYKNDGAFQLVKFTIKNGGADTTQPATTNSGQQMSNANSNANAAPTPEGKGMQNSTAGAVDPSKPLLTYSRPKGEYKAEDADTIMIDFWLTGAKLRGDGGEYRVRYMVDDDDMQWIDRWEQVVLYGWLPGSHTLRVELIGPDGWPYRNGDYNVETREILVTRAQ